MTPTTQNISQKPSATQLDLKTYLETKRAMVDRALKQFLPLTEELTQLVPAMGYSLMAGGKRLRPILCMAANEAMGRFDSIALEVGCALELIHTYSLIHDDLPAIDNDALRRGQPTSHTKFDEATAILAGDALLTLAFEWLSRPQSTISPVIQMNIVYEVSRAAGYKGMIQGQMLDIQAEGREIDQTGLAQLHLLKTGRLIRAAIRCGALIGQADTDRFQKLDIYAESIGLAFQVKDDLLNVEGDPQILGKHTGTDQLRKKATYPGLMGVEKARQRLNGLIESALQSLDGFDNSADPLRKLALYIRDRNR